MTPTISKMTTKTKPCEHCLAANYPDADECHYCGHSLKIQHKTKTPNARPRTLGEELTFHRFR